MAPAADAATRDVAGAAGPPSPAGASADRIVAFEARALGSPLRLFVRLIDTANGAADAAASIAWDAVRAEFEAVDLALSRFRDDSELTALNRAAGTGRVVQASWRLREALALIHRAGRMTGGRFDASVLADLERLGEHGAALDPDGAPAASPVKAGRPPGPPLDRPRRIRVPAAPLDTGGIGKGLALRWAARRAAPLLPPGAGLLLDAGGDVVAAGEPSIHGWPVGIEDPVRPDRGGEPVAVVAVDSGAIATSSVRVRNWIAPDGRRVHHLLDPQTGEPARTGLVAVTVAGVDPAWSEVWSKALFLAGRRAIGDEARARGIAAWWVDDAGRLGLTPEARLRSAWVAEDRVG